MVWWLQCMVSRWSSSAIRAKIGRPRTRFVPISSPLGSTVGSLPVISNREPLGPKESCKVWKPAECSSWSSRSMRMIPTMLNGKWRKLSLRGSPSSLSESRMFCQNQSLSYFLDTIHWLDATAPPLQKHLGTLSELVKKLLVDETTRKLRKRLGPEKISVARLPITGSDVFGREEDLAFLNDAWANQHVNVVTIVAWAGVGKSTLVNHWLRRMAAEHYRSADLVFGWSFYRQGTSGGSSSADEFLEAALTWFGDPDQRIGTGWEKGERLAKLIARRRSLLVLDGLEPLQNPPGPQEGRLRDPSLQALLRELAAFNTGLCVITTRLPVADLADHERTSALRRELEQLSSDAGANLLRALGVKGGEAELRSASDEFSGHCLALTLLSSYLTDAFEGDVRRRDEVSARLAYDVRL